MSSLSRLAGSKGRAVSTTMGYVSMLRQLLKDPKIGKLIVPIIPDEGRTFGMESIIRQVGIYASQGQLYKPHDQDMLLYYREEKERPDSRRGHHRSRLDGVVYGGGYGVFELQRHHHSVLHLLLDVRLPADRRHGVGVCRRARQGLPDGRNGRTYDAARAKGLQHQDGHSIVLASTVPTCHSYDPTYRVRDGGDRAGRHSPHVRDRTKTASTTSRCTTKTTRCRRCRRVRRRHSAWHLQIPRGC